MMRPLVRLSFGVLLLGLTALPSLAQEINCAEAKTQADMNMCADQDYRAADEALNDAYREAMGVLRQADAEDGGSAAATLKDEQRAWISYRDDQCAPGEFLSQGTMGPLLLSGCLSDMTKTRTQELESIVQEQGD